MIRLCTQFCGNLFSSFILYKTLDLSSAFAYQAAFDRGRVRESIPILFKALIAAPKHDGVRRQLVRVIETLGIASVASNAASATPPTSSAQQQPGGLRFLLAEMREAAKSPAALAFVAQAIKEVGAVRLAVHLYELACDACVGEHDQHLVNMALTLVHAQETCVMYQAAFDRIKRCLVARMHRVIGGAADQGSASKAFGSRPQLAIRQVLSVLKDVSDIFDSGMRCGLSKCAAWHVPDRLEDAGVCKVAIPSVASSASSASSSSAPVSPALSSAAASASSAECSYSAEELDLLALVFTAVKILFVVGALQPLPALIALVEPVRVRQQLHLTNIRNEQAYYTCIAQLLRFAHFPLPLVSASAPNVSALKPTATSVDVASAAETPRADAFESLRPVYVVGDSHAMAPAWQVISWRGERRILFPKVVTGLKCFHMRPESDFYPKTNLFAALETIPRGSDVVFAFGEIDCREGLLLAFERCKYESIDEGICATVDFYFDQLVAIHAQYKFRMFVHPVVPVLDATRPLVLRFNAALCSRSRARHWPFRYLDFFDALLSPLPESSTAAAAAAAVASRGYNREYELDGTHLNPLYVPLIESALNALSSE